MIKGSVLISMLWELNNSAKSQIYSCQRWETFEMLIFAQPSVKAIIETFLEVNIFLSDIHSFWVNYNIYIVENMLTQPFYCISLVLH